MIGTWCRVTSAEELPGSILGTKIAGCAEGGMRRSLARHGRALNQAGGVPSQAAYSNRSKNMMKNED